MQQGCKNGSEPPGDLPVPNAPQEICQATERCVGLGRCRLSMLCSVVSFQAVYRETQDIETRGSLI